jgi:hypothetical protein
MFLVMFDEFAFCEAKADLTTLECDSKVESHPGRSLPRFAEITRILSAPPRIELPKRTL